jgi:hypothetical protein
MQAVTNTVQVPDVRCLTSWWKHCSTRPAPAPVKASAEAEAWLAAGARAGPSAGAGSEAWPAAEATVGSRTVTRSITIAVEQKRQSTIGSRAEAAVGSRQSELSQKRQSAVGSRAVTSAEAASA